MSGFTPAQTGFSRVFLIEGRARADHRPAYQSCLKAGAPSQALGDVTKIECPDPNRWDSFIEVGQFRGAEERVTANLMGHYASDLRSELLRLARKRCPVDVQVHFGACSDPSAFNTFTKSLIFEQVIITNYGVDDLGALGSSDRGEINETGDISAQTMYEVLPLTFARRADDLVTNEILDLIISDVAGCGNCGDETDGCQKIYAITKAAGGSPSTPADVVYSKDKGATWATSEIDSLGAAEDPSGIAAVGSYIVVVSRASGSLHYLLKSSLDASGDDTWAEVTTGFVANKGPNDIWSVGEKAFVVGNGGYIYEVTDPTAGATVLDAGVAVTDDLNTVHAISDEFAVAVGNAGAIVKTENGTIWTEVTPRPVGVGVNFTSVWVKSEKEWWVGGSDGNLYYTLDGGTTWSTKTFSGSGSGQVRDIVFATPSVGYLAHSTSAPRGRILRTYDGGYSWNILPEGAGTLPANDYVGALAVCAGDANFVVGAGLADDASDGFLVVGSDR